MPDSKIIAFPPGFRMMAGNTFRRSKWDTVDDQIAPPHRQSFSDFDRAQQQRAGNMVGFNCLHYNRGYNEDSLARHYMPEKGFIDSSCPDGVRAEIMFPTCWNGELDSPNHADHVAYPRDARNGPCPPGFDQRLPGLFYETVYVTSKFINFKGQYVFANGDPTGYGYHGDFFSAWEGSTLQDAIDNVACTNPLSTGEQSKCPVFDIKDDVECVDCKMETPEGLRDEKLSLVDTLPGNVQVFAGPGWADPPAPPTIPIPTPPSVPNSISATTPVSSILPSGQPAVPAPRNESTTVATEVAGTGTAIIPGSVFASATTTEPSIVASPLASTGLPVPPAGYTPSSPSIPPYLNTSGPPDPPPTSSPASSSSSLEPTASMQSILSYSTDAAGLVVEWVILQEIETTTVYVDSAGRPTLPPVSSPTFPAQPVKRHRHRHNHVRAHL